MKHTNIRIARLKEMIALEEKRASLQTQIATVDERISIIQGELYGAGSIRISAVKAQAKGGRKGRGELKGQILEMLQAAGKSGVTVKELAGRIGVKTVNIHSWFSANIKKMAGLKKVGEARYALNGAPAIPSKPAKKAKAKKGKVSKTSKTPKVVAKKAKAPKAKAGRGVLKEQILDALKSAGAEGITIKDLAAKLKANYKNVYIWFVTTGKKIAGIKKVGPARYKLEAA